jgi:hypothetical protein
LRSRKRASSCRPSSSSGIPHAGANWELDTIAAIVIDFDALARDPQRSSHIQAAFDSGDHLHPGDSGYKAMADSIDLPWQA